MPPSPELLVDGRSRPLPLDGPGPWVMGRSADADLPFPDDPGCSREQARILQRAGHFGIEPISTRVPTLVNGHLLAGPVTLSHGDEIRFAGQRLVFSHGRGNEGRGNSGQATEGAHGEGAGSPGPIPLSDGLVIGRLAGPGIHRLDHPNVSRRHAALEVAGPEVRIRDLGSTNGTFVNGVRIDRPTVLRPGDRVDIGPFALTFTGTGFQQADRTGNVRLTGRNLSRVVTSTDGRGPLTILDDVTVAIEPREFVCIIGPSGSGKSTLMNALSGRHPATSGRVQVNDLELYPNFEMLKGDIALVPQSNVLHEALTLRTALDYTGRLRLPTDLAAAARGELVESVARSVELHHRLDVPIGTLSGGQKRRASLASETLNRPGILFLDEVTSGLDESTDRDIMRLLRGMADDGMTVVCVTHTLANIEECCHRVIVMANPGVLAFSGTPAEALDFFGVDTLGQVFDRLAGADVGALRSRFRQTPLYARQVASLPETAGVVGAGEGSGGTAGTGALVGTRAPAPPRAARRRAGLLEPLRQFGILVQRNVRLLLAERRSLIMAATQSVVIGLLLGFAFQDMGAGPVAETSRGSLMLLLGLSALWFGCNGASKEIVGDLAIYRQERNVNLSTAGFVLSKFTVSGLLTVLQVLVVFALTAALAQEIPGDDLRQLAPLLAGALAGTALGLLISAATDTRDQATTLVPLALVPQFILSKVIVPALPTVAVRFAEVFVTGYWIVEGMRAVYAESPVVMVPGAEDAPLVALAAASSGEAVLFIALHGAAFLAAAWALTTWRSRPAR